MPDLLIELRSEEIPARMQARAAADLRRLMTDGLVEAGLTYAHAASFAGPRRLTLAVEGLTAESPATREERKGPRTDAPEQALAGFLRSTGLTRDQLVARPDKKGEVWIGVIGRPGRPAAAIVAEVLEATVRSFPWPKAMRWGDGDLRWVRPLRSILCILHDEAGATVVPVEIGGITAGDVTVGHRRHAPEPFAVVSFEDYAARLKRARVILSAEERAGIIRGEAEQLAFANGLDLVEDAGLLAEVAGLVEWPVVLMGRIGDAFLDLPPEVLQTSMREHQKFFSVKNPGTGRIERFVTVANVATADDGETILAGNGRVLAARLSDAKFFWENDLRTVREVGLEGMAEKLKRVTFHAKLGSQWDRIERIAALAREIAGAIGADPDAAELAARVAKADLASEVVYEFPELQGIIGRYYAEAQGLSPEVARTCAEHYAPLGPSDATPTGLLQVSVALADKIDTLTGFWAIDEKPTGSKDPYALRRAALGTCNLINANLLRLALRDLISTKIAEHEGRLHGMLCARNTIAVRDFEVLLQEDPQADARTLRPVIDSLKKEMERTPEETLDLVERKTSNLLAFLHDRLKVHLRDEGIRHDVIDACLAMPGNDDLTLLVKRARALQEVVGTPDGENLIQGFKRANNILAQAEAGDGVEYSFGPDRKLAQTDEERVLFDALDAAEARIAPAMAAEDFATAMAAMAALRGPIDAFFEAVQVNTDAQVLRRNRLNLLHRIRETCLSVADLRRLEG